jgi:uncharacterized protein YbbK (DUF523 family)
MTSKILISACLLGENVRYDGNNNLILHPFLNQNIFIPICPETLGGLSTPRVPAEIREKSVITKDNIDVSQAFYNGAKLVLDIVRKHEIKIAILKEKSPSCGVHHIYDGSFTRTLVNKSGITTTFLKEADVIVFNEHEIDEAMEYYSKIASK